MRVYFFESHVNEAPPFSLNCHISPRPIPRASSEGLGGVGVKREGGGNLLFVKLRSRDPPSKSRQDCNACG